MLISECAETNGTGKISPSGQFAVLSKSLQVKLYELGDTLRILTRWNVMDEVTGLEWSKNSELILCQQKKRGIIQIFNSENYSWNCTINPGVLGISHSLISPDNRNILTIDSQGVRVSIWNLTDNQVFNIKFPKYYNKGFCFSFDGSNLALITREKNLDFLSIYKTEDWVLINSFQSPINAGDIYYLPDSSAIILWTPKTEYNFLVVKTNGTILAKFDGNSFAPGIGKVEFNANYMAVCGVDYRLRVFHFGSWVLFHDFSYKENFEHRVLVLKESEDFRGEQVGFKEFDTIKAVIGNSGETGFCVWGGKPGGMIVCTILKNAANYIWIWDLKTSALSLVVIMRKSVKSIVWADGFLVWVCGENQVYMLNESYEVLTCNTNDILLTKIEYKAGSFLLQNKHLAVYSKLN